MNGTLLCCEFANTPNLLKQCGPVESYHVLNNYILTKKNPKDIQKLLTKFESLYPYLQLIAGKHGLHPFDDRVAEAYLFGNELLDVFTAKDYRDFLPKLGERGLPDFMVKGLQKLVPEGALPYHAFHVFFVKFQVTRKVSKTLENMVDCMVSWGEIIAPSTVRGPVLNVRDDRYVFEEKERSVKYGVGVEPKIGDKVAVHWGECVHILNQRQYENLQKYTEKVISAVNSIHLGKVD